VTSHDCDKTFPPLENFLRTPLDINKATADTAEKDTGFVCSTTELSETNSCDGLEMKLKSALGVIQQAGGPETAAKKR